MTNNTTTNSTADSIMDLLGNNSELAQVVGVLALFMGGVLAYGWFKIPQVRFMITKLIKKHDTEILELYEKHLTPKMRKQLDAVAEKHVKDEILKQVIMTTFDHTEDKAQGTVKKLIRDIAKEN